MGVRRYGPSHSLLKAALINKGVLSGLLTSSAELEWHRAALLGAILVVRDSLVTKQGTCLQVVELPREKPEPALALFADVPGLRVLVVGRGRHCRLGSVLH